MNIQEIDPTKTQEKHNLIPSPQGEVKSEDISSLVFPSLSPSPIARWSWEDRGITILGRPKATQKALTLQDAQGNTFTIYLFYSCAEDDILATLADKGLRQAIRKALTLQDNEGWNPITYLFDRGDASIITSVLRVKELHGAIRQALKQRNNKGKNPLNHLFREGNVDAIKAVLGMKRLRGRVRKELKSQTDNPLEFLFKKPERVAALKTILSVKELHRTIRKALLLKLDCWNPESREYLVSNLLQHRNPTPLKAILSVKKLRGAVRKGLKLKNCNGCTNLELLFFPPNVPIIETLLCVKGLRRIIRKELTVKDSVDPRSSCLLGRIVMAQDPELLHTTLKIKRLQNHIVQQLTKPNWIKQRPLFFLYNFNPRAFSALFQYKKVRRILSGDYYSDQFLCSTFKRGVLPFYSLTTSTKEHLWPNYSFFLHHATKTPPKIVEEVKGSVSINQLIALFKEIPFDTKEAPGYLPLPKGVTKESLLERLSAAIHYIITQTPSTGTSDEKHLEEVHTFYKKLENVLKHLILKVLTLKEKAEKCKTEDPKKASMLLEEGNRLVLDFAHKTVVCATGWNEESRDLFAIYLDKQPSEKKISIGLNQLILNILQVARDRIAKEVIQRTGGDAHVSNAFYFRYGKMLGLSYHGLAYDDPLSPEKSSEPGNKQLLPSMLLSFASFYKKELIIQTIREGINSRLKDLFIDYLKENRPRSTKWEQVMQKVTSIRRESKNNEQAIFSYLKKQHAIPVQKTLTDILCELKRKTFASHEMIPEEWDISRPSAPGGLYSFLKEKLSCLKKEEGFNERANQLLLRNQIPSSVDDPFQALEAARKLAYAEAKMEPNWDTPDRLFAKLEAKVHGLTKKEELTQLFCNVGLPREAVIDSLAGYFTPEELVEEEEVGEYLSSSHTETGSLSDEAIWRVLSTVLKQK